MRQRATIQSRFGQRVRALRKAADLTQQQFAKRASMDWKYVGAVERGERNVTLELVQRIADAFKMEPVQLFLFEEEAALPPERVTAALLADRLGMCSPDARRQASAIATAVLRLALQARV